MSEENVDVVRASPEAYNTGDMQRLWDLYHPDVILRMPEEWPERGPFVGRDAVFGQFERLRETWAQDSFEILSEFLDIGDRVLVRNAYTVRAGRIFGLESRFATAFRVSADGETRDERLHCPLGGAGRF